MEPNRGEHLKGFLDPQRDCSCGWERFTKLESIWRLADGEPINDKEGATSVLWLEKNHLMEGASENEGPQMVLEALPKITQRLKPADEKMPAELQNKCALNEGTSLVTSLAFGEEDLSPAPWGLSVEHKTGIFVVLSTEHRTFWGSSYRAMGGVIYCASRCLHRPSTVRQDISKKKTALKVQNQTTSVRDPGGAARGTFEVVGDNTADPCPNRLRSVPTTADPCPDKLQSVPTKQDPADELFFLALLVPLWSFVTAFSMRSMRGTPLSSKKSATDRWKLSSLDLVIRFLWQHF